MAAWRSRWAKPVTGISVGLIAGATAFWTLHPYLQRHSRWLAATSAVLALLTLGAALLALVGGAGAVRRAELPGRIAVAASVFALAGFVVTAVLVGVGGWRSAAFPRSVAAGLVGAAALVLVAPLTVGAVGAIPPALLVLLLGAWACVLLVLARAIPHRAVSGAESR